MEEDELRRAIEQGIRDGVAAATRSQSSSSSSGGGSGGGSNRQFGQARAEFQGALGDLTGVISRAGGSITEFSTDVTNLAGRLPLVGGALEFFGGSLTSMVNYVETTNRTFQALSKVGGGFNGDLGALRAAAANTRMPLDQFANMVGQNAQAIASLGMGVNNGARRFAELSRAMFEDGQVIRGMMNLGYTIEEANEFLLDNASILRRQAMREGMTDAQVTQATLRMAENIAFMAEITGESAEQQKQDLIDAQRDGKNIAALRLLEAQGIEGVQEAFNTAFQGLEAAGPAAQAYLQDMIQSGAPMSDMTRQFAASQGETAAEIARMAATIRSGTDAETKRQQVSAMAARASQTSARELTSTTNLVSASLGQVSGYGQSVADQLEATETYRLGVEEMQRTMSQERGGAAVGFAEAAQRYEQEMRDRIAAQSGGGAEGQAISRELNMATIALADSAAGVNQEIGRNLSANTELQRSATAGLRGISNIVAGMGQIGEGAVKGLTPGDVNEGLLRDANNFTELFTPLITTNALRTEITNLPEILEGFSSLTPEQLETVLEQARIDRDREQDGRFMGGPVGKGIPYTVGEKGPETFVPGADGAIVPNMDRAMSNMQNAVQTIMPNMRAEASSMQSSLMQMATNLRSRVEQMSTTGQFDPNEIISELRGAMSSNPNISTQRMEQLLDTLNQSMLQLVSINNNMSRNGAKTVDALRGASGNLLQGVRAR